jgi:glycosyltransferase involved in cell wall biosynthesis
MLTILLPTKNRAHLLEPLLPILLSDKCPAEKVLICNDGSTDKTQEILNFYKDNKKLTIFENSQSIGAMRSHCLLFKHVTTKYFMQMGDDDYFDMNLVEELLNSMELNNSVMGFGKYRVEDSIEIKDLNHPGWSHRKIYGSDFLTLLAHDHYMFGTIFQTSLVPECFINNEKVPYDLNLNEFVLFDNIGEFRALDWDIHLNMSLKFPDQIYFLEKYISTFRKTDGSLSSADIYQHTGRAAFEMSVLILKYLANYEIRRFVLENPVIVERITQLLVHKQNQIIDKSSQLVNVGYLPIINAAKTLLDSLRFTPL